MEGVSEEKRYLSLHERFSLARRNAGFPAIILLIVSYPNSSLLPSYSFLQNRIKEVQEHFPILSSQIKNEKTTQPYLVPRENNQIWEGSDILSKTTYGSGLRSKEQELDYIFANEPFQLGRKENFFNGPGWQIRIHTHPTKTGTDSRAYLSLAVDHIFTDGRGILSLLDILLSEDISSLPYETLLSAPKLEDTINIKPSLSYLLPIVFKKILLPKLPNFIQGYLKGKPSWPSSASIRKAPIDCISSHSILSLPPDLISSLKTISKERGIKTLHGLFKTAFMVGIWSTYKYTITPFNVAASTPRSERNPKLGHSICMANYVSSHKVEIGLNGSDDFWTIARKVSDDLVDTQGIEYGRMGMGMLAYVPDGEIPYDSPAQEDPKRPTKWEEFFLNNARSDSPFDQSLSLSNLGNTKLPPGANDLIWGQEASPFAPPFNVCVIGHQAGFRMITVWMDGSAVIKDEVKELEKVFERVLRRLVQEGQENTTLENLTQA